MTDNDIIGFAKLVEELASQKRWPYFLRKKIVK